MSSKNSQIVKFILDNLKKAYNIQTDTALAKLLGLTQGAIANWKQRGTVNFDLILKKCDNISLDYLISGKEPRFLEEKNQLKKNGMVNNTGLLKIDNIAMEEKISELREISNNLAIEISNLQWMLFEKSKN